MGAIRPLTLILAPSRSVNMAGARLGNRIWARPARPGCSRQVRHRAVSYQVPARRHRTSRSTRLFRTAIQPHRRSGRNRRRRSSWRPCDHSSKCAAGGPVTSRRRVAVSATSLPNIALRLSHLGIRRIAIRDSFATAAVRGDGVGRRRVEQRTIPLRPRDQ